MFVTASMREISPRGSRGVGSLVANFSWWNGLAIRPTVLGNVEVYSTSYSTIEYGSFAPGVRRAKQAAVIPSGAGILGQTVVCGC